MILRLAEQLDVPLRERNRLLLAGGFAPAYPEHALDEPAAGPVRDALRRVLAAHEPYPALLVDRWWELVDANARDRRCYAGVAPALLEPPVNVLRLSLHPDGLAPRIVNLGQWRAHLLEQLARRVAATGDARLRRAGRGAARLPRREPRRPRRRRRRAAAAAAPRPDGELSFFSIAAARRHRHRRHGRRADLEAFYPPTPPPRRPSSPLGSRGCRDNLIDLPARLRAALVAADFTVDAVARAPRRGRPHAALVRNETTPALPPYGGRARRWRPWSGCSCCRPGDRAPRPRRRCRTWWTGWPPRACSTAVGRRGRGPARLPPVRHRRTTDLWVVSDLTPGPGRAAAAGRRRPRARASARPRPRLAQLTMREPVGRALDLGTGCGVQALHLAGHSDRGGGHRRQPARAADRPVQRRAQRGRRPGRGPRRVVLRAGGAGSAST